MSEKGRRMKTAIAHWNGRVAPVFDVAERILVVESEGDRLLSEAEARLPAEAPVRKAAHLAGLGIETLVCGAISRALAEIVETHGIRIVPFVAGELRIVLRAWLGGRLGEPSFRMPGCRSLGRGLTGRGRQEAIMIGRGQGGRGRGAGGGGKGRGGGALAAGVGGVCVCPKCSHSEPHQRGIPCVQRPCPKCGTAMIRK